MKTPSSSPSVPHGDDPWRVTEDRFQPERSAYFASLFTIGNGRFGTRGTPEETAADAGWDGGYPATYLAGFFDSRPGESPEIANGPHWLPLRVEADGEPIAPGGPGRLLAYERTLDLKRAVLTRSFRIAGSRGRIFSVKVERFAALSGSWVTPIRLELEVAGGEAEIRWSAGIDGDTRNEGYPHYVPVTAHASVDEGLFLRLETRETKKTVSVASHVGVRVGTRTRPVEAAEARGAGVRQSGRVNLAPGRKLILTKWTAWATSPEGIVDFDGEARARLAAARSAGWRKVLGAHEKAWTKFWDEADVEVEGDPFLQKALRFSLYHLRIAIPEGDPRISIAAKTLSGPGYAGRVFWDTELFILPFFDWVFPGMGRQLLMYRYLGLPGARRKARSLNCEGAAFPWESADTGDEACPVWLGSRDPEHRIPCRNGVQQLHVTGDVAAAWDRHVRITGDRDLLFGPGAEILYETARFWATRATHVPARGRYEIRDVVGPDEYHEGVANNFYTNSLARWNIRRALTVLEDLRREDPMRFAECAGRTGMDAKDLWHLRHVADRILVRGPDRTGLIEQFDGYFDLENVTSREAWEKKHRGEPFWARVQGTQFLKQPDVVMYHWLFPDEYPRRVVARNFDYYLKRTIHGSSLSLCIHAIQAAQLGRRREGLHLLRRAAGIDLADEMGNSNGGIHAAAAGGVWMGLVLGLAGIREGDDALRLNPALPAPVTGIRFGIRWRGIPLRVEVRRDRWRVAAGAAPGRRPPEIRVETRGRIRTLAAGGEIGGRLKN